MYRAKVVVEPRELNQRWGIEHPIYVFQYWVVMSKFIEILISKL